MSSPLDVADDLPTDLSCDNCGDPIDSGYVPVDGDAVRTGDAVCQPCGWADVGAMGRAPTLSDFSDAASLLRVERDGDGARAVEVVDERE